MLDAALIVARFLHYGAVTALFGMALFPFYAYPSRAGATPAWLAAWMRRAVLAASVAAFLTAIVWFALGVASMYGEWSAAVSPVALATVIGDTGFGRLWAVRLALGALAVAIAARATSETTPERDRISMLIGGALAATLAGTGHTQVSEGLLGPVHVAADALHLLAAGAWLGGLVALGAVLARPVPDCVDVLHRFSGMGYAAVAVLISSGVINSYCLVGSLSRLLSTGYGEVLLIKLCLVAGMLCVALSNRFWLVPALEREGNRSAYLVRLRGHVLAEQALGGLVLAVVSVLGTLEPGVTQS
jgi:copper resistance protein D